jgi:hypothetical protein
MARARDGGSGRNPGASSRSRANRALVERNLDHAQQLAERVSASEDFELLADVPLNIVSLILACTVCIDQMGRG